MNLKPFYDAAQAAAADVLKIAGEIETAFNLGTEEGTAQAMAQKTALDEAQVKAQTASDLYQSMKKAASTGDAAAKFVMVTGGEETTGKKVITRAAYEALSFQDRHDFFKNGGSVVDALAE
jgi:hypothetical protein